VMDPTYSSRFLVGTAAWTIPAAAKTLFGQEGSHLERYADALQSVEINTSFYRDHQANTYARWARSVPADFRFSVKLSRRFTHDLALKVSEDELAKNLPSILSLGDKLGVILMQLPPKLSFQNATARDFFKSLRKNYDGDAVIEPRHRSWSSDEALSLLKEFSIGKVRADPEPCASDWRFQQETSKALYIRWHGTPDIYESRYSKTALETLACELEAVAHRFASIWIIFDNTTFGWATVNALEFQEIIRSKRKTAVEFQGGAP
jgi:uncharacterized protein YecE (DUF72 family)